jgi:hypothetical protein
VIYLLYSLLYHLYICIVVYIFLNVSSFHSLLITGEDGCGDGSDPSIRRSSWQDMISTMTSNTETGIVLPPDFSVLLAASELDEELF